MAGAFTGLLGKAAWDTAYINDLPDSAFAAISDGGEKDEDGKITPHSLRHLPHHTADGSIDLPHLRNALARLQQTEISAGDKSKAQAHLEAHAKAEGMGDAGAKSLSTLGESGLTAKSYEDGSLTKLSEAVSLLAKDAESAANQERDESGRWSGGSSGGGEVHFRGAAASVSAHYTRTINGGRLNGQKYGPGTELEYVNNGRQLVKVRVTRVSDDLRGGKPGFNAEVVEQSSAADVGDLVSGYEDQIVRINRKAAVDLVGKWSVKDFSTFHLEIKSAVPTQDGQWLAVEGYASVFNIKDRDGEVMTRQAIQSGLDEYRQNPILLYNHATDREIGVKPIGKVSELRLDDKGLWIKALISRTLDYAAGIASMVEQGMLKAFSVGAPRKAVQKIGDRIVAWPLAEISIVPIPSNALATFNVVKGMMLGSDLEVKFVADAIAELEGKAGRVLSASSRASVSSAIESLQELLTATDDREAALNEEKARQLLDSLDLEEGEPDMTMAQDIDQRVAAAATKAIEDFFARKEASDLRAKEEETRINDMVEKRLHELATKNRIPLFDVSGKQFGAASAVDRRFQGLDAADMAFAYCLMKAANGVETSADTGLFTKSGSQLAASPQFLAEMAGKAYKEIDRNSLVGKALDGLAVKSDEVNYSTLSSYGDDWVPTLMSTDVWEKIRLEASVVKQFRSVEMPSNPWDYPLESTDPTIYKVAETADEAQLALTSGNPFTKSRMGTTKVTFTAGKLGAMTAYSQELTEDSVIAWAQQLRAQYEKAFREQIDVVVLYGDETTSTGNIANEGGSISAASRYLILDGLVHTALIDTVANSSDVAGAVTATLIKTLRTYMGTAGKYGVDPTKLILFCDPSTYMALTDLDEVVTVDKFGLDATIKTGALYAIAGIPIIVPELYGLTSTTGKINITGSNNTKGSMTLVRRDGYIIGYRRQVGLVVDRIPYSDAHYIMGTVRMDLGRFDAEMSAYAYDITV